MLGIISYSAHSDDRLYEIVELTFSLVEIVLRLPANYDTFVDGCSNSHPPVLTLIVERIEGYNKM